MIDRFEQGQWEESFSRKKGRERHKRRENQSPMPSPTKGNRSAQRQHVDTADGIGSTKSVILALLASQQQQQQPLAICARDSDAAGSVEALRVQLAAKDKQIAVLEATLAERRDHQARLEETNAEMRAQINSLISQAKITQQQMAEQTRMPSPPPPPPVVTESSAAFKALTDLVAELVSTQKEIQSGLNQRKEQQQQQQQGKGAGSPSPQNLQRPKAPPPKGTWAELFGAPCAQTGPPPAPPCRPPSLGLAASDDLRTRFLISGLPESLKDLDEQNLLFAVSSFLREKVKVSVSILDAYYLGPPDSPRRRICIRVAKMAQANEIVRNRHHLKGGSTVVLDLLSPDELVAQRRLRSAFEKATKQGHRAQFNRARLFITKTLPDGTAKKYEVTGP